MMLSVYRILQLPVSIICRVVYICFDSAMLCGSLTAVNRTVSIEYTVEKNLCQLPKYWIHFFKNISTYKRDQGFCKT